MMTTQRKCNECKGSGKTGLLFKSTCRKCGGKGYVILLSSPDSSSGLSDINKTFQQIEQLILSKQITQLEKANKLLDMLCIPEYTKLQQLCFAQYTNRVNNGENLNIGDSLEILDSGFRMAARCYNEIGKAYCQYALDAQNNSSGYIQKGIPASQMALRVIASSPGDADGRSNHIKASAHFGLGVFSAMQEQTQIAKKHFQECINFPLLTNHQVEYAGVAQKNAKQMLQKL